MMPRIFLATATILLACGSANAFNLGGFIQKGAGAIGGAIGNTSCTAAKCGAPTLGSDTVSTCFKRGDAVIQQNPNCATAFFNQQCQGQPTQFGDSCAEVGRVIGRAYAGALPPPGQPPYQQPPMNQGYHPQQPPMNQGGYNQHPPMNQGYHPQQQYGGYNQHPPMNQGYHPQQQQGGYNNQYQQRPAQQQQGGYNNQYQQQHEEYGAEPEYEQQDQNYEDQGYPQE